ncbi:MAG TPA: L,D-transpeptidase family protein [Steroidobacteraceae bacterium]|nr:L,D-transpeptidase family protein [Steroidobacteraceae bacterium]
MNRTWMGLISFLLIAVAAQASDAPVKSWPLPLDGESVVGEVQYVIARHEDTLLDIGRRFSVGYEEMVAANPGVNTWLPGEGTRVRIPTRYVLPEAPREGIIVNLPEHRIYYYPKPRSGQPAEVITFAVSIGKMDWKTPLGLTKIVNKRERPAWYPPESVRKEHEAEGRPLPKIVPPGPDNPLGDHAMRLGIPGGAYLIHGTNRPAGVGMQVTHGCMRMYPEDIEWLYSQVAVGTPVRIVDQPVKMGWLGGTLYMEVHAPLEGHAAPGDNLTDITRLLVAATRDRIAPIDWAGAERAVVEATGVPEPMSLAPAQSAHLTGD